MDPTMQLIVSLASSLLGALAVAVPSVVSQHQTSKLTIYRIDRLETKVDKHNNLVERMALVESKVSHYGCDIDQIYARLRDDEKQVQSE